MAVYLGVSGRNQKLSVILRHFSWHRFRELCVIAN